MALITPQPQIEREKVSVRLDRPTLDTLCVYCEWLRSSKEWIINRALEHLFARDRDFQTYLRTRDDGGASDTTSRDTTREDEP